MIRCSEPSGWSIWTGSDELFRASKQLGWPCRRRGGVLKPSIVRGDMAPIPSRRDTSWLKPGDHVDCGHGRVRPEARADEDPQAKGKVTPCPPTSVRRVQIPG